MKRRLIAGFVLAALLVAAIVGLAYWSSSEAVATNRAVAHTYDVIAEIERTLAAVIDAETGERGFVITHDQQFLTPYVKAREASPRSLARLRSLTADNPGQQERIARLAPLIDAKFSIVESIVALASESAADSPSSREALAAATKEGRTVTLQMRAIAAEMREDEERLLAQRVAESNATRRRLVVVYSLLAVAGLGLLGLQYAVISRHLSERLRAEEAARDRDALLRSVIEGTSDSVFVKDREGRYTMINAAVARTLGRPESEVLGRTAYDVLSADSAAYIHNVDMAVMDSGDTRTHEDEVVIQGVRRTFLSTRGPLLDGAGRVTGLFGMSREITERKKAETALVALNRDLGRRTVEAETANRELEAFSYSVSHDLRAPLRHISGFVDLLQKRSAASLDAQGRRYLDTIAQSAKHMGQLVDDLLVFSRMGRTEFRSTDVDLAALIAEVILDTAKNAGEREIEWVVGPLPHVRADPSMLRLVIVNLIENAVKYTRPRPRARVQVIGSASSLVVQLEPEYVDHTWKEITGNGLLTTHNPNGDSLYGADISTHPKYRHEHIGKRLYDFRKELVIKLNVRRMISGGRLFNYCEYADKMSAVEYAQKVIQGQLRDPVLSFELENGFNFIKILPNYMDDIRSLNYASFIEWPNPNISRKR